MPIDVASEIEVLPEREFHSMAEKLTGVIFDVHNDLGRLMNEAIYKQTICRRCKATSLIPVEREVEIRVYHQDFSKQYFMDLLFAHGLMCEAKTVEKLNATHRAQALHYLLLSGMQHGLLVNLRPDRVEKEFVSTTLNLKERRRFNIIDSSWSPVNLASIRVREVLVALLDDWGGFLQTALYREAIVHFFGGEETVLQKIPIYDGQSITGTQEVCVLGEDTALAITSLKRRKSAMSDHLQRFLDHTKLACLQWINMDNHDIELKTFT